ncbi:MAG: DUF72 domain-containing protein, partial [Chitinophagaceae bacterium]
MMQKKGKIHIGTSGWKYKHWDGTFYPPDLKKSDQLAYYTKIFNTVELNNSFYRQPKIENYKQWKSAVPDGFLFSVKANRFFTHMKKLKVNESDIITFLATAENLSEKLGPILFQLPPKWNINTERLSDFLKMLPRNYRYTFEFRNATWYRQEIYDLLTEHNCAFCSYELAGHQSPLVETADFVYVRLHGPGDKYQGSYADAELENWASLCAEISKNGKDIF